MSAELGRNFPISTPDSLSYSFSDGLQALARENSSFAEFRLSTGEMYYLVVRVVPGAVANVGTLDGCDARFFAASPALRNEIIV